MRSNGRSDCERSFTCSYAHRMKNARGHAPIAEVLDAAGVPTYIPRGTHSHDDEERWMTRRQRSLERMQARRDKRRCTEPGWCDVESPSEERSQETAGGTSWESRGRKGHEADEEADSEEEERITRRIREAKIRARANNLKKMPRSYRVVNPDRGHPPDDFREKYAIWHPNSQPTMSSSKSIDHDEAYMLTQEVLEYTFGKNP